MAARARRRRDAVALTQLVFTVVGLCLLLVHLGRGTLATPVLAGIGIMATLLAGFYLVQRRGVFGTLARALTRLAHGADWTALTHRAVALDARVGELYRERRAVARAGAWHLSSWAVGAGEVWLALHFLGHPVGLATAVLLESLGQAVRASAFLVPGALGVQEGGYMVLGSVLGIGPETSLALSLAKRVRELCFGLPGLVAWQLESMTVSLAAEGVGAEEASKP
jgi:putative membrane protein